MARRHGQQRPPCYPIGRRADSRPADRRAGAGRGETMVRVRRDQYTYRFAPDVPPVARVRPGDTVVFETYDASTGRIRVADDVHAYMRVRDPRRVNPAAGPVWVEGARPGDELVVTIEAIRLTEQGYIRATPGGLLAGLAEPVAAIVPVEDGAALALPGGLRLPAR